MRLAGHAFGSVRGLAPAGDSVAGRYFALTTLTPSCMNPLHRRHEIAWPALSTAGTRKVERQSYRGRCRTNPATCWMWSAGSWNVSAPEQVRKLLISSSVLSACISTLPASTGIEGNPWDGHGADSALVPASPSIEATAAQQKHDDDDDEKSCHIHDGVSFGRMFGYLISRGTNLVARHRAGRAIISLTRPALHP